VVGGQTRAAASRAGGPITARSRATISPARWAPCHSRAIAASGPHRKAARKSPGQRVWHHGWENDLRPDALKFGPQPRSCTEEAAKGALWCGVTDAASPGAAVACDQVGRGAAVIAV